MIFFLTSWVWRLHWLPHGVEGSVGRNLSAVLLLLSHLVLCLSGAFYRNRSIVILMLIDLFFPLLNKCIIYGLRKNMMLVVTALFYKAIYLLTYEKLKIMVKSSYSIKGQL